MKAKKLPQIKVHLVDFLRLRQDGPFGIHADDDALWAFLLKLPPDAGDGAARASAQDHHVHLAAALGQDLLGGGVVVGKGVAGVAVLKFKDNMASLTILTCFVNVTRTTFLRIRQLTFGSIIFCHF